MPIEFCADCRQELTKDNQNELGGMHLCDDCYKQYCECEECDSVTHLDDACDYHGQTLCQECYDAHFQICECCEDTYDYDYETERGNAWGDMCPSCSEEHFICDSCGETFHENDHAENGLCVNCSRGNRLHDYHSGADCGIVFHPNNREPLYFGAELETDGYNYNDRELASEALLKLSDDEHLFWLEEDGSLSNGIEIITQPCTLAYHRDKFPWKAITDKVKEYGGKSHDTSTCGLHIHFSLRFLDGDRSELYQLRLVYLFEKFWDNLVRFSRRDIDELDHFARKYNNNLLDKPAKQKIYDLRTGYFNHYQCVNLEGTAHSTIEIRLFRGTLRAETILASIELVDFLVRLVKKTSTKKLQAMTWTELTSLIYKSKQYRYLPDYLHTRELNSSTVKED